MLKTVCAAAAALLVLVGCGPSDEAKMLGRLEAEKAEYIQAAKEMVRNRYKDPDAVIFRNERFDGGRRVFCGEANAKNAFGGYVGYEAFAVTPKDGVYGAPGEVYIEGAPGFSSRNCS